MRFSTTLIILAHLVVSSFAVTIADVETDINKIIPQVTKLDNDITSFPNSGGSISTAFAIHTDANNLGLAIDKGTTDTKIVSIPISQTDGQRILDTVLSFEPIIEHALSLIISKKAAFRALPIGGVSGVIKRDLTNLNTSTSDFGSALIEAAPADLVATATALKDRVNNAFAAAIAAYAT